MRKRSIFPAAANRDAWEKIAALPRNRKVLDNRTKLAEKVLDEEIPQLPASLFMEFARTGNRSNYEEKYFERRKNLSTLVIAECAEYKGRFIDHIIDYLWAICSEPLWGLPAHVKTPDNDPLPDPPLERLNLFSAETGMIIALTLDMLEPELYAISPQLVQRIRRQLITRIVEPWEDPSFNYWWFNDPYNNWAPWICSNSLCAVLTALENDQKRAEKIIAMMQDNVERYIRQYSDDGCCDEGPTYWGVAPVMMLYFYEQLGFMPVDPKIRAMAEYIIFARMTPEHLCGFADAMISTDTIHGAACIRFGKHLDSPELIRLGIEHANTKAAINREHRDLFTALNDLFWYEDSAGKKYWKHRQAIYYERLQMLFVKDNQFSIAVKRGYAGSHFHADIGQFILFCKNRPVITDLGRTDYTRETFSPQRFNHWVLNAEGHNIPQFNGIKQITDPKPDPDAVTVRRAGNLTVMEMDLTSAYPVDAGIISCRRVIECNPDDHIFAVTDSWELASENNRIRIPLYTPAAVTIKTEDSAQIGNMEVQITAEHSDLKSTMIELNEQTMIENWGRIINRLDINCTSKKTGSCTMVFSCR